MKGCIQLAVEDACIAVKVYPMQNAEEKCSLHFAVINCI
jgi:hypothetical protein